MSLASLERAIAAECREVLKNPRFKVKDILEWSTADIKPRPGEIVIKTSSAYVATGSENDKRVH